MKTYPPETPQERRRRIGLESAIKRRARNRYAIQVNLHGPHEDGIWPRAWLPFTATTAAELWDYLERVNVFAAFPNARSISVELVR